MQHTRKGVLAVPWRLRGNDDELADAPGEVLFFKDVIVAKELLERAERWRTALALAGWPRPPGQGPILALQVGAERAALALQERLEQQGLLAVAIRPPTVPPGSSRLRLVLRRDLPSGSLDKLLAALGEAP